MLQFNNEFYPLDKILSKKFPKGWFYGYTKTQDHSYLNWTLHECVFDLSEFDFVKLARSLLLYIDPSILQKIYVKIPSENYTTSLYELPSLLLYDDITKQKFKNKNECFIAGYIYNLSAYPDKHTVNKIVIRIIAHLLGATKISYKNKEIDSFDRTTILEPTHNSKYGELTQEEVIHNYTVDLEPILPYIEDYNNKLAYESKRNPDRATKAVVTFLEIFAGFTQHEIDYVIDTANRRNVPIRLSKFYNSRRLLECIPHYLRDELIAILCGESIEHSNSMTDECPMCWLLDQYGMIKKTCKVHEKSTKSEGDQI